LREKEERAQVIIPYWHWNDKETDDLDGEEIQSDALFFRICNE